MTDTNATYTCRKFGLEVAANTTCAEHWMKSNIPTMSIAHGCWSCNWRYRSD